MKGSLWNYLQSQRPVLVRPSSVFLLAGFAEVCTAAMSTHLCALCSQGTFLNPLLLASLICFWGYIWVIHYGRCDTALPCGINLSYWDIYFEFFVLIFLFCLLKTLQRTCSEAALLPYVLSCGLTFFQFCGKWFYIHA